MPTAERLAEQRAKNRAYEEQRRRHARQWFRHGELESDPEPEGGAEPAASGTIHDKRQRKLDL